MNRPRFSILEQFDPLISEETESTTPTVFDSEDELSDPEKENTVPEPSPGDMTMHTFFTKGYKQSYPTPVKLTKRLIDVGDITVASMGDDEDSDLEVENQEDRNDEELCLPTTPRPTIVKHIPNTPRTPLADIPFQDISAALHKASRTHHECSPELLEKTIQSPPLPHSSLSLVINTVNSTGVAFGKSHPATSTTALLKPVDSGRPHTPHILVHSPEEDLTRSESLLNKVSAPFDMTELDRNDADISSDTSLLTLPILRKTRINTSSDDPIRQSLDLHTSFQLHLQSPESSFDLLNDKISFLDGSSRVLPPFSLEDNGDETDDKLDDDVPEENSSVTPTNSLIISPGIEPTVQSKSPISPTADVSSTARVEPPSEMSSPKKLKAPSSVMPESATILAPIAAERGAVLSTPGYRNSVPYIPPVPALRITKRTKRYDTKAPKPTAICPPLCRAPAPELSVERKETSAHRRQIREQVFRTPSPITAPLRHVSTSSSEGKPPSAPAVRLTEPSQPVQPAKPGVPMPMRIAPAMYTTSRPQNILAQRGLSHQTSAAASNGSGNVISSRRVMVSEHEQEQLVNQPNPLLMAAKRPEQGRTMKTRSVLPARTTSHVAGVPAPASGVPRPVGVGSKLPAPTSGIARFKGTIAGGVAIRGLSGPRKAT